MHLERLRRGGLHSVGQLETFDARAEFVLHSRFSERTTVQFGEQVELRALALVAQSGGAPEVVDRLTLGTQPGALIHARQEARAPVERITFRQAAIERIAHHDEAREVSAFRAETVSDPRADTRRTHARDACVHHEERRAMIVGLRPARVNERQLIHVPRRVWKQITHPRAALPVLLPFKWRFHQRPDGILKEAGFVVETIELLAVRLRQSGFVIERVDMAGAAVGKNPNNRLGARAEVRALRRERIEGVIGQDCRETGLVQQRAEIHPGQRRGELPAQPIYVLEAPKPAAEHAHL